PASLSFSLRLARHPYSTLFPYTTLFRSVRVDLAAARRRPPLGGVAAAERTDRAWIVVRLTARRALLDHEAAVGRRVPERLRLRRSEEHTSELQSRFDLVCRLLLEKKKNR